MQLGDAEALARIRWQGMRKEPNNIGWARALVGALGRERQLDEITTDDLILFRDSRRDLTPATRYALMSVASVLFDEAEAHGWSGTKPRIPYPHVPRPRKWWLNPQQRTEVLAWLNSQHSPNSPTTSSTCTARDLAQYIQWACTTGLRVEETLRVAAADLFQDGATYCLSVPGTKTTGSEATIPIAAEAWALAQERLSGTTGSNALLFPMSYRTLYREWSKTVSALGWPRGMLKALRRSFARDHATMPLPMLQQIMRHGSPATTLEYLRLTGGQFTTSEMAQWVK